MIKIFQIEVDSGDEANLTTCNMIREILIKAGWHYINVKELQISTEMVK